MDIKENITVRRTVYEAACRLEKAAVQRDDNLNDWNLAEWLRDTYREIGLSEEADHWHEVYQYLMSLVCMASGVAIDIVEDSRAS